ncbi:MAG: hypothetical protein ACK5VA_06285 [Pseudanabaena sp.]|jgi:hypothetical protein
MNIEIPDHQAAALAQLAEREGLTLGQWLAKLVQESTNPAGHRPLKTGRGMFAPYGPAPSAEEIDGNRREMFRQFAEGDS